jgi:phospholipid-binding lipoprotein MlaA
MIALGLGMGLAPADAQTAPAVLSPVTAPSEATAPQTAQAEVPPPTQDVEPIGVDASTVSDPWEGWNRKVYAFNNAIDRAFAEPFARTYQKVTPTPVRSGVRNWVNNLGAPVIFANDLFQGEPKRAGVTALRFGLNTTVGLLGLFDPAKSLGLERHDEDFGQTLGRYGAKPGPYLMLPILGPSSIRDAFGAIVDVGLDPLTYAQFDGDTAFRITRTGASLITARTDSLETVANLRASSTDSYVTLRTAYAQARRSLIRNGQDSAEDLPDFGDPLPDDEASGPTEAPK